MTAAMLTDLLGLVLAAWGLVPRHPHAYWRARHVSGGPRGAAARSESAASGATLVRLDSARLTGGHWRLLVRLLVGLALDTMKPATIGFMLPGLRAEYGISPTEASLLPLLALTGTTIGSVVFGLLGDIIGRRPSFLLTALLLAATAVCGLMPTFPWQLFMCFVMGLAAGGELPVIYTLLAEVIPARHRGWMSVMVGGLGGLGGFLAASVAAIILEPALTWRGLFLMNLPTALFMILLMRWVPESPRFLVAMGFHEAASRAMASVGVAGVAGVTTVEAGSAAHGETPSVRSILRGSILSSTIALMLYALAWGFCNWGFITWPPTILRNLGHERFIDRLLAGTLDVLDLTGLTVPYRIEYVEEPEYWKVWADGRKGEFRLRFNFHSDYHR